MNTTPTRAHISRAAIERLYIEMRHLLVRGRYKPMGRSGENMIKSLHTLHPEIYGTITDPDKVELDGLLYIFQRLPQGIEECRYIKLISREGLEESGFTPLIPSKRRRNCYRIDDEQMYIEMTRGRSDVYDVLTHLTFLYNEAEKIGKHSLNNRSETNRAWQMVKKIVKSIRNGEEYDEQVGLTYLSTLLGRTYEETATAYEKFTNADKVNDLFSIVFHMGRLSQDESLHKNDREVSFSSSLVDKLGHHVYGEQWATNIKNFLVQQELYARPVHIISSNMHSVLNSLYAPAALAKEYKGKSLEYIANELSKSRNKKLRDKVRTYAKKNGLYEVEDHSGTNIPVQVIDCSQLDLSTIPTEISKSLPKEVNQDQVIIVMDYAFGEQAFETMDELLKPLDRNDKKHPMHVSSVNIMGKAGILKGGKGDIMIPQSHIMEGNANNYPFENELSADDFADCGLDVYEGNMITVLGTSLQNEDILRYFLLSSWGAIGLEMEGAHYQKAIQAHSHVRNSISRDVKVRYAYYASDNPLETGSTLASGSLGLDGVKPTYAITVEILKGVFS